MGAAVLVDKVRQLVLRMFDAPFSQECTDDGVLFELGGKIEFASDGGVCTEDIVLKGDAGIWRDEGNDGRIGGEEGCEVSNCSHIGGLGETKTAHVERQLSTRPCKIGSWAMNGFECPSQLAVEPSREREGEVRRGRSKGVHQF